MSELLADKTAVVTGGASGIGRGIVLALAEHGADVVVADLEKTNRVPDAAPVLEAVEDETNSRAAFVECDVSNREDLEAAVDRAEEFGGIDIMVNNAGIVRGVEFLEATEEDFESVIDVNLKGTYFGCQVAAQRMVDNGGGSIINIASTATEKGFADPGADLYSATKGGVRSLTFSLAEILGPDVRVNAIQPGFTTETGLAVDNHDEEVERERAKETSLDRLGTPKDPGNAAVFFASELSEYVTAETLFVDGGWVRVGGP
ncbi:SDR family NAD(P)-dependent oxidoreductase [Natrarchaeobius sp. A-rgal3]|uniref:SDR family NAD(P)-dependent oxidoreductase n=1 Tax=Natrarchaeobius versutus TaxID=1679078 RepID=UPI003510B074